ncbi:MAG: winged helix-turn-helix domain-containing protein [Planctomycetales bacterium]|nr:winged helix-turn-helix domain-containing protein [Planctomycetales bacterium]
MATVDFETGVQVIGETAGAVWHVLSEEGPMSLAKLARSLDVPRDVTMQAVGWLAREHKIVIEDGSRGRIVSLRS